ncbi:MAG: hydroxymethylglutaryl-CoA synthase, partial [Candidatus Hydrothermarchaeota archaeon]|nr:hydroxymethylglutaryl-CoA synthase [Candidatus Hydrothermarchaeota archaeon]
VAYIIGKRNCLASIEETFSYTTDTPDFWRREGQSYPSHGGRFTGLPAYFKHVYSVSRGLMDKLGLKSEDFDYAVFHQPNGKFPRGVAKMLGLEKEQIKDGMLIHRIGNLYSGSSLLGLARVLDIAKPGDRILLTSFGSGAGSDSFSIRVEDKIGETRGRAPTVEELIGHGRYVDYATYARMKKKIKV